MYKFIIFLKSHDKSNSKIFFKVWHFAKRVFIMYYIYTTCISVVEFLDIWISSLIKVWNKWGSVFLVKFQIKVLNFEYDLLLKFQTLYNVKSNNLQLFGRAHAAHKLRLSITALENIFNLLLCIGSSSSHTTIWFRISCSYIFYNV